MGAGSQSFPITVIDIVRKYNIDVLCLLEPRISGVRADTICRKLGFNNWSAVESTGFAGGIWIMWNEPNFRVEYVSCTPQLLHCRVTDNVLNKSCFLSVVYDETSEHARKFLWDLLRVLAS